MKNTLDKISWKTLFTLLGIMIVVKLLLEL